MESDLRTYLLGDATVAALVGTRVYPVRLPQGGTFPAITYQRVSQVPVGRPTSGPPSVVAARVQFDVWSLNRDGVDGYAAARALADAVRQRLDGKTGALGSGLTVVQDVRLDAERDTGYDETGELYRISLDFTAWYPETSP